MLQEPRYATIQDYIMRLTNGSALFTPMLPPFLLQNEQDNEASPRLY